LILIRAHASDVSAAGTGAEVRTSGCRNPEAEWRDLRTATLPI
jgi:hypothetical protein